MFSDLKVLITIIQKFYSQYADEWLKGHKTFNTKRKLISDVYSQEELLEIIRDFHNFMNEHTLLFLSEVGICQRQDDFFSKVTCRVKTWNSINYKMDIYMHKEGIEGKVPVSKSFNDLFGIRIIMPNPFKYDQLKNFIDTEFHELKVIDSTKDGYKASHIYFMPEDKNMFPWELQVWYIGDEQSNLSSHELYKQGYIQWEKEFLKGGV